MKRLVYCVALTLIALAGCKPAANTTTDGGEETPVVEKGSGETTPPKTTDKEQVTSTDLPKDPARDVSAEQKQVDAMNVEALVAALGDDKLYLVAVDELKTRGPDAVGPLTAALDSENDDVKQSAMLALGMLGADAKSALPKLKEIAGNDDHSEVITATAANAVDAIEGK